MSNKLYQELCAIKALTKCSSCLVRAAICLEGEVAVCHLECECPLQAQIEALENASWCKRDTKTERRWQLTERWGLNPCQRASPLGDAFLEEWQLWTEVPAAKLWKTMHYSAASQVWEPLKAKAAEVCSSRVMEKLSDSPVLYKM